MLEHSKQKHDKVSQVMLAGHLAASLANHVQQNKKNGQAADLSCKLQLAQGYWQLLDQL